MDILRNYDFTLNCLNVKTFYSRRQHVDACNTDAFKAKVSCLSTLDTFPIRVPGRQIREFSSFSMSCGLS
jgi:hypothetical protein